jgi:DNA polymerase
VSSRRDAILREMGLAPLWRLRSRAVEACPVPSVMADDTVQPPPSSVSAAMPTERPVAATAQTPVARDPVPHRAWTEPAPASARDDARTPPPAPTDAVRGIDTDRGRHIAHLDWEALEADMRACNACRLHERRKQAVPGVGDRQADWMLVGEAPGAEEDQRGEPFVGAAGKLLDAMLGAIGLRRGEGVYIANAIKCRPPHNRTPQADEIATCFPYLERQIALVRPRILIALGRPAAQALLNVEVSIGASRGRVFHYRETPVVVTYHPAYLLRNQADKAKAWEDLCFARRLLG